MKRTCPVCGVIAEQNSDFCITTDCGWQFFDLLSDSPAERAVYEEKVSQAKHDFMNRKVDRVPILLKDPVETNKEFSERLNKTWFAGTAKLLIPKRFNRAKSQKIHLRVYWEEWIRRYHDYGLHYDSGPSIDVSEYQDNVLDVVEKDAVHPFYISLYLEGNIRIMRSDLWLRIGSWHITIKDAGLPNPLVILPQEKNFFQRRLENNYSVLSNSKESGIKSQSFRKSPEFLKAIRTKSVTDEKPEKKDVELKLFMDSISCESSVEKKIDHKYNFDFSPDIKPILRCKSETIEAFEARFCNKPWNAGTAELIMADFDIEVCKFKLNIFFHKWVADTGCFPFDLWKSDHDTVLLGEGYIFASSDVASDLQEKHQYPVRVWFDSVLSRDLRPRHDLYDKDSGWYGNPSRWFGALDEDHGDGDGDGDGDDGCISLDVCNENALTDYLVVGSYELMVTSTKCIPINIDVPYPYTRTFKFKN